MTPQASEWKVVHRPREGGAVAMPPWCTQRNWCKGRDIFLLGSLDREVHVVVASDSVNY
jgi:hypothetical protein